MNLRKKKTTNRLQDLFGCGVDRVQDMAESLRDDASGLAKRARRKFGRQSTSEKMMENVQDHPTLFIIASLALIGLVIVQLLFMARREEPELSPNERMM